MLEIKKDTTMDEILKQLLAAKKKIAIILRNGTKYQGKIIEIGQFKLRLKLEGNKSFFDAFIRIEDVSAVEVQVRTS